MKKSPNPTDKTVGARVRLARMEMGKSQEWLGDQLGLTFQQVQKYEKGTNRIGSSRMVQIAKALNRPVAWFFEGTGPDVVKHQGGDTIAQMLTTPGGLELAHSFLSIPNIKDRHAVLEVARVIANVCHTASSRKAA
jgi:transcriptional regulator with XRE-family HTH domain